ncbi:MULTISPECIES: hypothetical protein [Streptomyces]|uniref:hypothetical protein n=1 Tax=Streptomyces TaxID=1883 RepID=UPI0004BD8E6D|nr:MULTISPECIES: hypothetical protein [unclassified Streptomyces]KOT95428.1 hypothetical protein ADK87_26760 [Streptomyces sp. NRRL F-4711]
MPVIALSVTPNGVPVVGVLVGLALIGGLTWDVLRGSGQSILVWLQPTGMAVAWGGFMFESTAAIVSGLAGFLIGAAVIKWCRWHLSDDDFRRTRKRRLPPI